MRATMIGHAMPMTRDYREYDVCQNCLSVAVNDDDSGRDPSDPEPLSLVLPGDYLIHGVVEHNDGCIEADRAEHGCDCADLGFRNRDCDGCGGLPGDRFRMIAFVD